MVKNSLKLLATGQVVRHGTDSDIELLGPIGQALRPSIGSKKPSGPLVSCLLGVGCPSHIPRLVITVVVNAVDAVLGRRLFADASNKPLKSTGTSPLITHGYPTLPVVTPTPRVWFVTAGDHSFPCLVFGLFMLAVPCHRFQPHAAAGFRLASPQAIKSRPEAGTTIAYTSHNRMAEPAAHHLNDRGFPVFVPHGVHCLGAPQVTGVAAAGFGVSMLEICRRNLDDLTAFALTQPEGVTQAGSDLLNSREASILNTFQISCCYHPRIIAHMTSGGN